MFHSLIIFFGNILPTSRHFLKPFQFSFFVVVAAVIVIIVAVVVVVVVGGKKEGKIEKEG